MNRRDFIACLAVPASARAATSPPRIVIPVRRALDTRARWTEPELRRFYTTIWDEALGNLSKCGVDLHVTTETGEIRQYPSGRPKFMGVHPAMLNVMLTDSLPMAWDGGRAIAGTSTIYEGHHVSVIALRYAHGHRLPWIAVNTVLHELLHFLLLDVFVSRPGMIRARWREERVDWHATRLWLLGGDDAVRQSAGQYLQRLRLRQAAPADAE